MLEVKLGKQSAPSQSGNVLLSLFDKASNEIDVYRQRQISTFREAIMVLAVITWGLSKIVASDNKSSTALIIRGIAAFACISTSAIGSSIIMSYKKRIYYIREMREKLVNYLLKDIPPDEKWKFLFYPTSEFAKIELEEKYRTSPTSSIYSVTLIVLGISTAGVNILVGFLK